MLLLGKHGTRHHEGPRLTEGKLFNNLPSPLQYGSKEEGPGAEGDIQYPDKGVGEPEQEQDRGEKRRRPKKDTGHTSVRTLDVAREEGGVQSKMTSGSPVLGRYGE